MAPTAPQSKELVIQPKEDDQGEGHEITGKTIYHNGTENGMPMTEVTNWVKDNRLIEYPLDADGKTVGQK